MVSDEVQFVKKHKYPDGHNGPSYQAHTPIKDRGGVYVLNVAINHAGLNPIYQTTVSQVEPWREKHLNVIKYAYLRAPYFETIYPQIEKIILKRHQSLADLNISTILWALCKLTGLDTTDESNVTIKNINENLKKQSYFRLKSIIRGSESQFFKNNPGAIASEMIIGLCKEESATEYFCGGTAIDAYLDKGLFAKNGIKIVVQDWQCPEYPQQFIDISGFPPNLSIIDLLMNMSAEDAREILNN